ncbi:MAG: ABC-2 family transporter protein [Ruminococcus sp.]|nr:ABC-2 family transporter protein [Ruminococcus sp.]
MKKKLRIYKPFISAGMQEVSTYRINWIFFMIGNVMGCFVSYFIWKAVFLSGDNPIMNGFTMPQMVVYIFLMFLTSTMISSGGTYDIGEEIRDGSIAMRIIKPISYNSTFLFQELGSKFMTVCLLIVPLVFGVEIVRYAFTGSVQFEILNFLLYILSCVFAYLINFFFNICFGFIAFVIKYLWGANMMKNCIVGFLSGTVIPLSFLPGTLEKICLLLPFASLNYTPVMIYMGIYHGAALLYYIGLQLFWVLAFWGLSKLLWSVSMKHLSVQGG